VHYIGLDDKWDENIDLNRDGDRIRPGGTMTALIQAGSRPTASLSNPPFNTGSAGRSFLMRNKSQKQQQSLMRSMSLQGERSTG
jgi:hypothetical protein